MTDQIQPPAQPEAPPVRGFQPTGSTWGSAIGAAVGVIVTEVLKQKCGLQLDVTESALILAGFAALGGYFFEGGRK